MSVRIGIIVLLTFCCGNLGAQSDSLRKNHLYSFSIQYNTGLMTNSGNLPQQFLSKITNYTEYEKFQPKIYAYEKYKYPGDIKNFQASLSWKKKIRNSKFFSFADLGISVGYQYQSGNQIWSVLPIRDSIGNLDTANLGVLSISSKLLTVAVYYHTKPILKNLSFFGGIQSVFLFSTFSTYSYNSKLGSPGTWSGLLNQINTPVGIKYNLSCELNLELIYTPGILALPADLPHPAHWATISQIGLQIRYKLDTNPVNMNNRRKDMFY